MDNILRASKTVLVVDDGEDIRLLYAEALSFFGYHVIAVECGAAALVQLGQRNIDAIVTDLWMPRMTGAALAAAIRADVRHFEIPISLVSSTPPENEDPELFDRVLRKPCDLDHLLTTVDHMCFPI